MSNVEPGPCYWHFDHGADIGIGGIGETMAQAFERTGQAMMTVVTDVPVRTLEAAHIHCHAPDRELLLVDWLNALIYEMSARHMVFGRFEVRIDGNELFATAWGEPVDVERHHPAVEVKGATYTELRVAQDPQGRWLAQTVIDV
jgi:SHS2 domain-containing protein